MLRLPRELRDLFGQWLVKHFPNKARHVLSLIREMRDGKLNDATPGKRMTASGPYAWMIGRRFELATDKLGYRKSRVTLRSDLFRTPGQSAVQLSLF